MANKDTKDNKASQTASTTSSKGVKSQDYPADRHSDLAPVVNEELARISDTDGDKPWKSASGPDEGERLAAEAVEERDNQNGIADVKIVEKDGIRSAVTQPLPADKSDNGKVYKDPRINPRDTNAPDAGLTPDGIRVAE